ncbi:hypothetical protein BJP25_22350 [Actinokineospora bangkokensis]|uniref:Mce-associated membrane protein n=1 Tax=Actinokineospora bangkokensis TaxID=1193682 RepID=A0A1Q9LJX1_9PSEU|nr:hypothetical protein BJP25_22350 [Actinokineospora bangkokensis]
MRVAAVVLLVLAIAFAGWAGVRFLGTDEAAADTANTRDDALRAARSEIIQFNTLDYRTASDVYAGWLAISTGKLREDLVAAQQAQVQRLTTARTVTRAEIDDLGVVDLDAGRGTATVIAAVRTTVTPEGAEGVTKRVRIQAELARTDQGWLLSSIGQVDI